MGTDFAQIVRELTSFYDFAGKTVSVVGAGDGKLIDYLLEAKRVTAVDEDARAIARLADVARARGLDPRFDLVTADFTTTQNPADTIVFEFCLHEMASPKPALDHARTLARDVIVIDHAPGSLWSWYAGEEAGVDAAWAAVEQESVRQRRDVDAVQRFTDFEELAACLSSQGATALTRIDSLREQRPITIPMPYRLVLL